MHAFALIICIIADDEAPYHYFSLCIDVKRKVGASPVLMFKSKSYPLPMILFALCQLPAFVDQQFAAVGADIDAEPYYPHIHYRVILFQLNTLYFLASHNRVQIDDIGKV